MRFYPLVWVLLTCWILVFVKPLNGLFSRNKNTGKYVFHIDRNMEKPLSPVIFVPGDGGSQMEAKLNKPDVVHYICQKTADYFNIWLNLELLVPLIIDCWIDNVRLIYDPLTRTTKNSPGVTTRIPGWGNPDVVEWLDPTHASAGAYFKDVGNALVAAGYVRNVSIRGAPYDFRKAPDENEEFFINLKILVEETYVANGDEPITFIVHSMGGPMTLVFLQRQTEKWKATYVKRIISLAGAWAGSVKAVKVFAVGDDLGSYALNGKVMRAEQITSPSLAWLLPSPHFWKPDEVLVQNQNRTYTLSQLEEFFDDLHYRTGWEMREDTIKYTDFTAPGVEIHCLYGSGIDTVEKLDYKKSTGLDGTPTLVNGDGDGTVNARSLKACGEWKDMKAQNGKEVTLQDFSKVDHMTVLSDARIVKYILDVMVG